MLYGILATVVGGLIVAVVLGLFETITSWTVPWQVWVFAPLFALVFGFLGLLLARDWRQQVKLDAVSTRAEVLRVMVQNVRKDLDQVDAQHLELIESVPEAVSRSDERLARLEAEIGRLQSEIRQARESAHRSAVTAIVDRVAAERGWTRRADLETLSVEGPLQRVERVLDMPGGLVFVDAWAWYSMGGSAVELRHNYLWQACKSAGGTEALLVVPNESELGSGDWGGPGHVKRVMLDELEAALRDAEEPSLREFR